MDRPVSFKKAICLSVAIYLLIKYLSETWRSHFFSGSVAKRTCLKKKKKEKKKPAAALQDRSLQTVLKKDVGETNELEQNL